MNLEIHTRTSLFHPFRHLDWLININGHYFALSNQLPWELDKFMKLVKDYKQFKFMGVYFRSWKRIAELQEYR
jgi:hypothetical protein